MGRRRSQTTHPRIIKGITDPAGEKKDSVEGE